jgi:hypothetical protein
MSLALEQVNNHRSQSGETPFSMDLPPLAEFTTAPPENDDIAAVLSPTSQHCHGLSLSLVGEIRSRLTRRTDESLALGKAVHAAPVKTFVKNA